MDRNDPGAAFHPKGIALKGYPVWDVPCATAFSVQTTHFITFKTASESGFFVDGRTDRPVPANTVPREGFIEDTHLGTGKTDSGEFASGFPIEVTRQYGMLATPTYHDDRLRDMNEGEIFNTITDGKNLMGRYGDKMSVEDQWAIVTYVRALQRAHQGTVDDVPPANRSELGL